MSECLRVVLADDHPLYVDGLRAVIEVEDGVELVGVATNGTDAVALALDLEPDVIVMDLNMPDKTGVEATREIKTVNPSIAVLVLTMFDDDASVFASMQAGASGYLLKGASQDEIARAIRSVGAGEAIFGPAVARRLITYFATTTGPPEVFPDLTDRERSVLDLIARGMRNAEIARELFLSEKTIKNYISNIFSKLQIVDRAQAIVRAREAGLGRPETPR